MSVFSELQRPKIIYEGSSKYNPNIKTTSINNNFNIYIILLKKVYQNLLLYFF